MSREHLTPARGQIRTGLGVIALAAALAVSTSACQSSSKASVVGQDTPSSSVSSSAAAVGAPSATTSSSAAAAKTSSSAPAAGGTFKIGQAVKVGDFTVTVHKMTYPYSSDVDQPDAGKAYVLLDVEVKNNSATSQDFSSMIQFGLRDSTNTDYNETIVGGADGAPPDGKIAAGDSMRGPVAFEVPAGSKGLQFTFVSDVVSGDKTDIDLGK